MSERGLGPDTGLMIEAGQEGSEYVVRLLGELDLAVAAEVESALRLAEESGADRVIVDVNGLDFIDSTGLQVFLAAARRSPDGRLRFTRGSGPVAAVFRLTALDGILPFVTGAPGNGNGGRPRV